MPTTVTKTVKSSGGDYTSLSAWEAGQQGDLVTADEIRQAECYSFEDTTAVTINGWSTDATRYIRIYTPVSERHLGIWNTAKYNLVVTDPAGIVALYLFEEYTRVEGLQVRQIGPTANGKSTIGFGMNTATSDVRVSNCIIRGHGDATFWEWDVVPDGNITLKFWNNLLYGVSDHASSRPFRAAGASSVMYVYNNTVVGPANPVGIQCVSATITSKNNLVNGFATGGCFIQTSGALTNTNCASSDATADDFGGSGNRVSQTFTFVNSGADDYHLASGDAGAKDFGVDLSADANLAFSDDIDGETRSGTWDIGADEYIAAGGTNTGWVGAGWW